MLKRIAKAVLTKKFLRHLRNGTSVIKIKCEKTEVFITPGSSLILCRFDSDVGLISEKLSPPRISDYIVEGGNFDGFMDELKRRVR